MTDVYTEVRPSRTDRPATRTLLKLLDELEQMGANLSKLAAVKAARAACERDRILSASRSALRAGAAEDIIKAAATGLADGSLTDVDAERQAVAASLAADGTALDRIYDQAGRITTRRASEHLAELGDKWIAEILRPLVDRRAAAIMAAVEPRRAESIALNVLDPIARKRDDDALRWDSEVTETWNELKRLHDIADDFRSAQIIPATRRTSDAWRWVLPVAGVNTLAAFVAHQHNGHEAGIYTEAETAARYDNVRPTTPALPPGNVHEAPGSRLGQPRPGRVA